MRTKNLYFFILFLILFYPFWGSVCNEAFASPCWPWTAVLFCGVLLFLSSPIYKAVFYVNYFILIAWKMMLILRLARRSQQVNSKCSSVFGWTLRLNYIYYDIIRTYVCPLKFTKKFHKKCVWKMGCIASHIYHTHYFYSDENSFKPRICFISRSNTYSINICYFRLFLISFFSIIC